MLINSSQDSPKVCNFFVGFWSWPIYCPGHDHFQLAKRLSKLFCVPLENSFDLLWCFLLMSDVAHPGPEAYRHDKTGGRVAAYFLLLLILKGGGGRRSVLITKNGWQSQHCPQRVGERDASSRCGLALMNTPWLLLNLLGYVVADGATVFQ